MLARRPLRGQRWQPVRTGLGAGESGSGQVAPVLCDPLVKKRPVEKVTHMRRGIRKYYWVAHVPEIALKLVPEAKNFGV